MAAPGDRGTRAGQGPGQGASGWAQARARAGGLCSARASVRAWVRRSALPHRVCGARRRLRLLICPRPRGGRRRPIRGAAALMDGPRPRPRYCSCSPRPPASAKWPLGGEGGALREAENPENPPRNEGPGNPRSVGCRLQGGGAEGGEPRNPPHCMPPKGGGAVEGEPRVGGSPVNHCNKAGRPEHPSLQ